MATNHLMAVRNCNKILQRESERTYQSVLLHLCRNHRDRSYTRQLRQLILAKDVKGLLDLADSLSSQVYDDATSHFVANQFAALIKKYPFAENPYDPRERAISKFKAAEHMCKRVNARFRARRKRVGKPLPAENLLERARAFILYVLGPRPSLEEVFGKCNFGPGASLGVHGNATNFSRKLLADSWTCTPSALIYGYWAIMSNLSFRRVLNPYDEGFTSGDPAYTRERILYYQRVSVCKHNKITFVPKTTKIDRSIAVEPLLNGYLQKGIDLCMRSRLKRVGIDLSDQSLNQRMARSGSYDEEDGFCTIDLSAASDSISIEVVRELLPPEWFEFLDATRSKEYELDGEVSIFEKFCSMGNGFCFPLETLIFASLCHAVKAGRPGKDFMVYGDDIIVRKAYFEPLVDVLRYCGFTTNRDKTFSSGPFRESCGEDFFAGKDVRPLVLDYRLDSLQNVFKFLNVALERERTKIFFSSLRSFLIQKIPENVRFIRPYKGNMDSAITSTGDEHLQSRHCTYAFKHGSGAWKWRELICHPAPDYFWKGDKDRGFAAYRYAVMVGAATDQAFSFRRKTRTKVRVITHPGSLSTWLPAPSRHSDDSV